MPQFFHGTNRPAAQTMVGTPQNGGINVAMGGGEFGRGFYTQDSKSNALTWAQGRYPARACILAVTIDNGSFQQLSVRQLTPRRAKRLTQQLRATQTTGTYTANVDVLIGPLNGSWRINQQKFESLAAQSVLNGLSTQRTIV